MSFPSLVRERELFKSYELNKFLCRSFRGSDGQCVNIAYSKSEQSKIPLYFNLF